MATAHPDSFDTLSWAGNADEPQPPAAEGPRAVHGPGHALGGEPQASGGDQLDCVVGVPLKENDGSKDAFVSYLVTTNVRLFLAHRSPPPLGPWPQSWSADVWLRS